MYLSKAPHKKFDNKYPNAYNGAINYWINQMAPRGQKVTKRIQTDGTLILPELVVRDPDTKYTGGEPYFSSQPEPTRRAGALVAAFNWYSRFFDRKMAKEQFAVYVENTVEDKKKAAALAKNLRRVEDREVMAAFGWLARLSMRGLKLTDEEQKRLDSEISRLIDTLSKPVVVQTAVVEKVQRPNVQEIMRDRAREAAGDLEGSLDEFIIAGAKAATVNPNTVGILTERNVLPQHISILTEVWKKKLGEFNEVLEGRDPQLVEAYSHYSKHQIKAVVKFIEQVLSGLDSYISVKKAAKAPRKRKAVTPEKQVAKIKFMKQFPELGLTSIHPAKIIGAVEVWAYDTAKRKLHYYVADSHVGTMGVKGSSILGFDAAKSGVKTVRKPEEILKKLVSAGKPASRKLFEAIKAVHTQPNGRTNENLIFLKAY